MSVDTKALLKGDIDIMTVAKDIIECYQTDRFTVSVHFTTQDDFYQINFKQKYPTDWREMSSAEKREWYANNNRTMCVFYGCESDYRKDVSYEGLMTYLSLGCWGDSVEIVEALLKRHGGYIMRNDMTDDWTEF